MSTLSNHLLPLILLAACSLAPSRTLAQAPKQGRANKSGVNKQEELKHVVARRIRQATGVPVRIGDLVYNVFNSTFRGKKISAGPSRLPFLRLKTIKLKLELMADRPGTTVSKLEATGMRALVHTRYMKRPLMVNTYKMVTVRSAAVSGRVTVMGRRGPQIVCEGVHFSVTNLVIPVTRYGRRPSLSGDIRLSVKSIDIGGQVLTGVALTGKLDGPKVVVKSATATYLGGRVSLSGQIGLPGVIDLRGDVSMRPWGPGGPDVVGKVRIKGPGVDRLVLTGRLTTNRNPKRRSGTSGSALPIKLQVRVGKRKLRGTLRRWRLR